ncbi:MAG: hypothetical protein HFF00_05605 [Ruminiclostridium sp.]|jgi:hypothetical protein|nr:hypothetical protein [Ruminiclostridium sp.]
MENKASTRVAFCGLFAAFMLVVMLLGTAIPMTTFLAPALAGALVIPIVWEFGRKAGLLLYIAVSILSLILAPDKEAAFLFLFLLGWYPILRPTIQHISSKAGRVVVKLAICLVSVTAVYALLLFVFTMPDLHAEAASWTLPLLLVFLVLGCVTFLLYDQLLGRCRELYVRRLRPKLFRNH